MIFIIWPDKGLAKSSKYFEHDLRPISTPEYTYFKVCFSISFKLNLWIHEMKKPSKKCQKVQENCMLWKNWGKVGNRLIEYYSKFLEKLQPFYSSRLELSQS